MATAPPAKRQRQGEEGAVIEILSTADEDDGEVSDGEGNFGMETETEEEEEVSEVVENEDHNSDDDDDEDWVESPSGGDDGDGGNSDDIMRENRVATTREPFADVVGALCHPENRSPQQTVVGPMGTDI